MTGLSIVVVTFVACVGALWMALAAVRQKRGALWAGVLFTATGLAGVAGALADIDGIRVAISARDIVWALGAFTAAVLVHRLYRQAQRG